MPKFEDVVRQIRYEIARGEHGNETERFMPLRSVAKQYGISLSTAQKAIRQLKQDRMLVGDATNPPVIAPRSQWEVADPIRNAGDGSPRRLALIVTDITNPFFSALCNCVQQEGANMGYQALVAGTGSNFQREKRVVEGFINLGVEGLLVCPGLDDECAEFYRTLLKDKIKFVFISRRVEGVEADSIVVHSFVGGASVAGHFLSMGYESFGYLAFGHRLKRDERLNGFRSALLEETIDPALITVADADGRDVADGYLAMTRLMEGKQIPRAVFAYNDLLAIGALQYCQDHGLAVPDDVAIAGFDDLPETRVTSPPLTTVSYPIEMIAKIALQNLVEIIADANVQRKPNRILLEPHLIIRRSSDPSWKPSRAVADEGKEAVARENEHGNVVESERKAAVKWRKSHSAV